jgi:hypothetical protein
MAYESLLAMKGQAQHTYKSTGPLQHCHVSSSSNHLSVNLFNEEVSTEYVEEDCE